MILFLLLVLFGCDEISSGLNYFWYKDVQAETYLPQITMAKVTIYTAQIIIYTVLVKLSTRIQVETGLTKEMSLAGLCRTQCFGI